MNDILDGYAEAATPELIAAYDALSPIEISKEHQQRMIEVARGVIDPGVMPPMSA